MNRLLISGLIIGLIIGGISGRYIGARATRSELASEILHARQASDEKQAATLLDMHYQIMRSQLHSLEDSEHEIALLKAPKEEREKLQAEHAARMKARVKSLSEPTAGK